MVVGVGGQGVPYMYEIFASSSPMSLCAFALSWSLLIYAMMVHCQSPRDAEEAAVSSVLSVGSRSSAN